MSACAAAIVSDEWDGLEEFLIPGEEVLLPRDEYEMVKILTDMPDEQRLQIGRIDTAGELSITAAGTIDLALFPGVAVCCEA